MNKNNLFFIITRDISENLPLIWMLTHTMWTKVWVWWVFVWMQYSIVCMYEYVVRVIMRRLMIIMSLWWRKVQHSRSNYCACVYALQSNTIQNRVCSSRWIYNSHFLPISSAYQLHIIALYLVYSLYKVYTVTSIFFIVFRTISHRNRNIW